jgi:Endoplasmic reticulum vesicle transporter
MFHYFLKIVSTQFRTLDGQTVNSHQYSATHFERDLTTGQNGNTDEGLRIQHGVQGMPGQCNFRSVFCRNWGRLTSKRPRRSVHQLRNLTYSRRAS